MDWKDGQEQSKSDVSGNKNENGSPNIPAGLESLYSACRQLYPEQVNPLQVTALVKYWLGGPDPLDYISMYENLGDPKRNIPPHWHYISFGLSDIHGDGRVHEQTGPDLPSGFGFELSLRLKREPGEKSPPTWPAAIMQGLAKYVFQSDSTLCVGDHVSWHCPLDNSESRIQHMLMAEDAQLTTLATPNGSVQFVQVAGITFEELQAAQHWNGCGVLEIMRRFPESGGAWLVTDMRRGESIYDLDPAVAEQIENGIEIEGSNLSGVSAKVSWSELDPTTMSPSSPNSVQTEIEGDIDSSPRITKVESEQIKNMLKRGLLGSNIPGAVGDLSDSNIKVEAGGGSLTSPESAELFVTRRLSSLHLTLNLESGALLPLALRGRLKHGRHFTFKSIVGLSAVTLVPPSVTGSFVDATNPYATHGPWLQVHIPHTILQTISDDLASLSSPDEVSVPITFTWPTRKLAITIVGEET